MVTPLYKTLEQELLAVLRGASLECLVCGEFLLHEGGSIRCLECGAVLREGVADVRAGPIEAQAG
jgi:ribosomal protein S27E